MPLVGMHPFSIWDSRNGKRKVTVPGCTVAQHIFWFVPPLALQCPCLCDQSYSHPHTRNFSVLLSLGDFERPDSGGLHAPFQIHASGSPEEIMPQSQSSGWSRLWVDFVLLSPDSYVLVLTPNTSECALIWRQSLQRLPN